MDIFHHFKKLNQDDTNYLKRINPFWTKQMNKWIVKLKKFTLKFSDGFNYFAENNYTIDNYAKLIPQIENYKNFLNKKRAIFATNLKILKKFEAPLIYYGNLIGFCVVVEYFIDVLKDIDKTEIKNKQLYAIQKINEIIKDETNRLFKIINKKLSDDEYITMIKENIKYEQLTISNTIPNIIMMFKYINKLFKYKKINESDLLEFITYGIVYNSIINVINYMAPRFINSLV
ncbi:hypothetical protein [Spiroplasma endosymbiont of Labia minor]|uniref:hypothetical protein n=1 Tax=Spiroplasma endosymbiont of Labia minor TaxID=3066305 RepID=UPI0030CD1A77